MQNRDVVHLLVRASGGYQHAAEERTTKLVDAFSAALGGKHSEATA